MVKGESKMSSYAEFILSYIMVTEKQSHGEPRQSTSRYTPFFFFLSQFFSQVFITESYEELLGKEWPLWLKEKKEKKKKASFSDRLAFCP